MNGAEPGGDLLPGALALGLALVHLLAGKLRFLDTLPRSRWLSMAGGASVAYVFLHLFPELASAQNTLRRAGSPLEGGLEIYLLALAGLAIFYGLERAAKVSRHERRHTDAEGGTSPGVFWLHMASFGVYNALVGYLLIHREEPGMRSLLLFFLAMALHFVVNDHGLREHHKKTYHRLGRWLLAGAVLLGWGVGTRLDLGELPIALLFAFLAGGLVLNVLKEELPDERKSRFWAFAAGAAAYSGILLLL